MSLPVRRQIEQLTQLIDELRKTQQEIVATSRQRTGWLRRAGGGGGVDTIHIKTPPGGIPAMTGSASPYTPGSASCDLLTWNGTTLVTGSGSETIYNSTLAAIAGGVPAQAKLIDGDYFIDVASCGS